MGDREEERDKHINTFCFSSSSLILWVPLRFQIQVQLYYWRGTHFFDTIYLLIYFCFFHVKYVIICRLKPQHLIVWSNVAIWDFVHLFLKDFKTHVRTQFKQLNPNLMIVSELQNKRTLVRTSVSEHIMVHSPAMFALVKWAQLYIIFCWFELLHSVHYKTRLNKHCL